MAAHSAEGIILRKYLLRETSYILVAFTKEFGKIKGVLKGVRSPYPQFAGNFEIFTRCNLLFYKKKKSTLDLITQCETMDYFLPIRKDIERLTYANYFIELIDIVTTSYDINRSIYDILLRSLEMLTTASSAKRISRIFELKLLGELGLYPEMQACTKCNSPLQDKAWFSVSSGGVVCGKCKSREVSVKNISLGTVNFIKKIQSSDLDKAWRIKVSKEVGEETEEVLRKFIEYHINSPIKTVKFFNSLESVGIK